MAILRDTQRFLHFNLTHTGASGGANEDNHYLDLGKLLSQANRRFYRQGMVYHVANMVFDDADGDADIDVCTMPDTWFTQQAWKKGFVEWLKQQRAAEQASGISMGKWNDFKIALNSDHWGDADNVPACIDVNGNTFPTGDWDRSYYNIPQDGGGVTEATIRMMGSTTGTSPNYTGVSLLEMLEWSLQPEQEDPDLHTHADILAWNFMAENADSEVVEEVLEDWEAYNDNPPYSTTVVPGAGSPGAGRPSSPWVARTCMIKGGTDTTSPVAAVGGFAVPCGLIMIETNSNPGSGSTNSIGVTVELVPGEYKGVHAYPMRGGGF